MYNNKDNEIIRIVRHQGNEYPANSEKAMELLLEVLGAELRMKNPKMFQLEMAKTGAWQCVIIDVPAGVNEEDPGNAHDILIDLIEKAKPEQYAFLVEITRGQYSELKKARRTVKNNVFVLHSGYFADPESNTPA